MNENKTNEYGLVLASGEIIPVVKELRFKEEVSEKNVKLVSKCTMNLIEKHTSVSKGYFAMVADVAIMLSGNKYKYLTGVKSMNQYLQEVIKCSAGTASDLIKVAKVFYTELGTMKDSEFNIFAFSELTRLAKYSEEVRQGVLDKIKEMDSHTRKDVIKAVDDTIQKLLITTEEEPKESNESDDGQESNESTDDNNQSATDDNEESIGDNQKTVNDVPDIYWRIVLENVLKTLKEADFEKANKATIVEFLKGFINNIENELNPFE